jgi:hypothetical protein
MDHNSQKMTQTFHEKHVPCYGDVETRATEGSNQKAWIPIGRDRARLRVTRFRGTAACPRLLQRGSQPAPIITCHRLQIWHVLHGNDSVSVPPHWEKGRTASPCCPTQQWHASSATFATIRDFLRFVDVLASNGDRRAAVLARD